MWVDISGILRSKVNVGPSSGTVICLQSWYLSVKDGPGAGYPPWLRFIHLCVFIPELAVVHGRDEGWGFPEWLLWQ